MSEHIEARVSHDEVLTLKVPTERCIGLNVYDSRTVTLTMHQLTDRDLRNIIIACQGELHLRRADRLIAAGVQ